MRRPAAGVAASVLVAISLLVAGVLTGRFGFYSLYTHCGVRDAEFGSTHFYTDPPLNDGSGNPPPGWGNPIEGGFIVVTDPDHAVFFGFLHSATFATHPKSGIPTIEVCS